jgi:hypothetical protein
MLPHQIARLTRTQEEGLTGIGDELQNLATELRELQSSLTDANYKAKIKDFGEGRFKFISLSYLILISRSENHGTK